MADKKVKPNDPVKVEMHNKHYKEGEIVEVHSNLAEKLIKSGKASMPGEKKSGSQTETDETEI